MSFRRKHKVKINYQNIIHYQTIKLKQTFSSSNAKQSRTAILTEFPNRSPIILISGPVIKQHLIHCKVFTTNKRTADGNDRMLERNRSEQFYTFNHCSCRHFFHFTASVQQSLPQYRYHWRQPLHVFFSNLYKCYNIISDLLIKSTV